MANNLHVVLGGSGAIGGAVIAALKARGLPVRSVGLGPEVPGVETVQADIRIPADLKRAVEGASHIYLCVGLPYVTKVWEIDWPRIMQGVIDAAHIESAKVIFFDNNYMYGPSPLRNPISEDHPIVPVSKKGRVRKNIAEMLMYAHSRGTIQAAIGRSADFYGPRAENSLLYIAVLKKILDNQTPLWLGDPQRLHSFTYTKDAGDALVELALADDTCGQVWHIPTKDPPMTVQQLVEIISNITHRPVKLRSIPGFAATIAGLFVPVIEEAAEMMYQSQYDYVFSSRKFMTRFPDFHVTSYENGIAEMVRHFWVNKKDAINV